MKAFAAIAALSLFSTMARADILEWQDGNGVRHYTNLKDEVPKEQRESVQVVVDEAARHADTGGAVPDVAAPASAEPARQAEVVYDTSQISSAYLDGLRAGLAAASAPPVGGGSVQVNGPLAVANAVAPSPYSGGYVSPYYYPFVTTSFDRGRSRHLTLRMLLQDQFAIDREGPFAFVEPLPPHGVDLNRFLPRGLPHRFPRETRVLLR